jgi:AmmeMemoRadiSam system protein A/AmmeMemoRadiSam system protein B
MVIRTSRVAGRFFPGDKDTLKTMLGDYAQKTEALPQVLSAPPRAVVSPHAGYAFCGGLTAGAWALTRHCKPARIAILSPSHHHGFDGIAVPGDHDTVGLPGMRVKLDVEACKSLTRARKAKVLDAAFEAEHGIDTQLPFARNTHSGVPVVPLVIGNATEGQVAAVIDRLDKMAGETVFILSSDLSHFLTQEQAQRIDTQTAGLIETGQGARLTPAHACGARAIAGWFASEAGRASRALRLGQFTSFNTTRDAARVVGYGSWALYDPEQDILSDGLRRELVRVARAGLASRLAKGRMPEVGLESFPVPLRTVMASFVTLEINGRLRGCIGSMGAHRPLVTDVIANAVKAGFEDKRFKPLTAAELEAAEIKVSVLTRPQGIEPESEAELLDTLVPGETGLILAEGDKRALFLPSVWGSLPEPRDFLHSLRRKAGLDPARWSETQEFRIFRAEQFDEAGLKLRSAA